MGALIKEDGTTTTTTTSFGDVQEQFLIFYKELLGTRDEVISIDETVVDMGPKIKLIFWFMNSH